jgi:hypothetical protein
MKIQISSDFQHLSTFLHNLPEAYDAAGTTIYKARNEIKKINIDGRNFVIKKYKQPHIINQIAYGFFRQSKAERAYEYAERLLSLNIPTPKPVAYIELRHMGLLFESYFISEFSPYPHLIRELWNYNGPDTDKLTQAFASFTADVHNKNVYPVDYSPGNILFDIRDNDYRFTLLDINRMQFRSVSQKMAAYSFRRLHVGTDLLYLITSEYAKLRGYHIAQFTATAAQYHQQFWKKQR